MTIDLRPTTRTGNWSRPITATAVSIRYVYDQAGNRINLEVVIGNTRTISVNYGSGGVGSFFTLRGAGFPPNSQVLILVNNFPLPPYVPCDGSGNFLLVLSTVGADYGIYSVSAVVASGSGKPVRLGNPGYRFVHDHFGSARTRA